MEPKHALHIACCASTVAFAFAHSLLEFHRVPVLWYYPLERRWAFEVTASGLAMGWYGRTLLAAAIATAVFGGAYRMNRRRRTPTPLGLHLAAASAAASIVLAMAGYTSHVVGRRPVPEPLPSWYVNEQCAAD